MQPFSRSTEVTEILPLDANSRLILPVPEHKSRQLHLFKSNLLLRILNNPVLAKSVVGRTGNEAGARMVFPLYFPLMMRKLPD